MINRHKFATLLSSKESSNNYKAVSGIGALGRYQFMPSTLNSLQNLYDLPSWQSAEYFLNNPALQEQYFQAHLDDLEDSFNTLGYREYLGRSVTGSKRFKNITANLNEYGIYAGMHLSGSGAVGRYFETGYDPNDGQTSLTDYMAYFSDKTGGAFVGNNAMFAGIGEGFTGAVGIILLTGYLFYVLLNKK